MLTFIIIAAGLYLLSGIVFKKNIKQNQFTVYSIIIVGSLIGTTIINGIFGLDVPYSKVFHKEKIVKNEYSQSVMYKGDTIAADLPIRYVFKKDSTGKIIKNYIIVSKVARIFDRTETDIIKFTLVDDSVCRVKIYKNRRVIDNIWITSFGLPSKAGPRSYEVLLPDTKVNNNLIAILNSRYYNYEEEKL